METIELDCAPGGIRPGDLIGAVIAGTDLPEQEAVSKFFGMWTWVYDVPRDKWVSDIQPIVKPRIEALYHDGLIRWGSW